jgi:GTPase Era involved in 16S rRNA processing
MSASRRWSTRWSAPRSPIVSRKVQTTRALIRGIVIEDNAQIILVDTPGIFSPNEARPRHGVHRLERAP